MAKKTKDAVMSLVSVVVGSYNRCESLCETLQALKAQRLRDELTLEIIVVDNNSTDQTKQVIEASARASRWPLRYMFEPQQGVSHARNRGIQESHGEIIAFTDDDVLPEPNWVQTLYDALVTHNADWVGGKALPLWLRSPSRWLLNDKLKREVWPLLSLLDCGDDALVLDGRHGNVIGANMAIRRQLFEEVGWFNLALGPKGLTLMKGEESELIARCLRAGKRVMYIPQAVVRHKVAIDRMGMGYLRRRTFYGSLYLALMSVGPRTVPKWLIRECATNGLSALWAYGRGQQERAIKRELLFWAQLGQIFWPLKLRWNKKPQLA